MRSLGNMRLVWVNLTLTAALTLSLLTLLLSGCATYQSEVSSARTYLSSHKEDKAVEELRPLADVEGRDQLVYMLDYATSLQAAGQYKESAKVLNKADRFADIQDYTSLSREGASMLLTEELVQYKGDDYEVVLINAINAINYLMLGDLDSGLVEVRRLNNKLYRYKTEAKRDYAQNPFAYYLGAVMWEADRKWDDAYIFYKKAYELIPQYKPLHEDLIRAAVRADRQDDLKMWTKMWPEIPTNKPEWKNPKFGELVVIYQQGWGPRKRPHPSSPRLPKLYPVPVDTQQVRVDIIKDDIGVNSGDNSINEKDQNDLAKSSVYSSSVLDVESVAIKTLDSQYAALVGKRVAGFIGKAIVSDQIRQHNQLLGDIAFIALNVMDRADLRQWSTLPASLQVARIWLPEGKHRVRLVGLRGDQSSPSGEDMPAQEIKIKGGRKAFLHWRSYR